MGKKYKYEFYYRIDKEGIRESNNGIQKRDSYILMDFERNLPLTDKEYEIASKKLIDSVANHNDVEKKYITPIKKKEYDSKVKMS